jgi:hypothetical protein
MANEQTSKDKGKGFYDIPRELCDMVYKEMQSTDGKIKAEWVFDSSDHTLKLVPKAEQSS